MSRETETERLKRAEAEQEELRREFLREAWEHTPHLMAKYRPPSYGPRLDTMMNSVAYQRVLKFGGRFVEFVERDKVLARYDGRCGRCGVEIVGTYHVDHIDPLQNGSDHSYANTQPLHPECHKAKTAEE